MTELAQETKARFLIRVIDDDPGILTGLTFLLACTGWKSIGYSSAEEFLEKDNKMIPGCILLDIRMPGMTGIELQTELKKQRNELPIIIITGYADVDTAVRTLKKGAFDFLQKPVNAEKLEEVLAECIQNKMVEDTGNKEIDVLKIFDSLSRREQEVFELTANGLTSKLVGERLGLSERTVQGHRLNISKKFNIHTKKELLACWNFIEKNK